VTNIQEKWGQYPVTVYLVDDQRSVTMGMRKILEDVPFMNFHACNNPEQALAEILVLGPTVILLDMHMPVLDGFDLLKILREHDITHGIPVLMLSVDFCSATKEQAFDLGADDYLIKTPDKTELVARLRYHTRAYIDHLEREAAVVALEESRSKLKNTVAMLERISSLDGLTDVANRRFFDEVFKREWQRSLRETSALSLVFIDLDYFKQYNDHYGHLAGDDCLKEVAKAMNNALKRPTDLLARYGGEEFVVLLPNTHGQGAMLIAERLRKAIEALNLEHKDSEACDCVTASLGVVTTSPMIKHQPHDLLDAADQALYQAKDQGRNQVICKSI